MPTIIKSLRNVLSISSDCCLTPTEQFSAISWREKVTFDKMMMVSTLH